MPWCSSTYLCRCQTLVLVAVMVMCVCGYAHTCVCACSNYTKIIGFDPMKAKMQDEMFSDKYLFIDRFLQNHQNGMERVYWTSLWNITWAFWTVTDFKLCRWWRSRHFCLHNFAVLSHFLILIVLACYKVNSDLTRWTLIWLIQATGFACHIPPVNVTC